MIASHIAPMRFLLLSLLFWFLYFTDNYIQVVTFLKDFWFRYKHGPIYTGFIRNRWLKLEEVPNILSLSKNEWIKQSINLYLSIYLSIYQHANASFGSPTTYPSFVHSRSVSFSFIHLYALSIWLVLNFLGGTFAGSWTAVGQFHKIIHAPAFQ